MKVQEFREMSPEELNQRFILLKKNYSISVVEKPLANSNTVKKLEEFVKISHVPIWFNAKENSVSNRRSRPWKEIVEPNSKVLSFLIR